MDSLKFEIDLKNDFCRSVVMGRTEDVADQLSIGVLDVLLLRDRIDGQTLEAIGKEVGLTRERVRQRLAKTIRMLNHPKRTGVFGRRYWSR